MPLEFALDKIGVVDGLGRATFETFHGFRDCQGFGNSDEEMNMVLNPSDSTSLHSVGLSGFGNDCPNLLFNRVKDELLPGLGAEHAMVLKLGERIGHSKIKQMIGRYATNILGSLLVG